MTLAQWLGDHELSFAEFGRRLGVTTSEARRFALGERIPRRPTMQRVFLVTGGAVTPNDFYDLPSREVAA
jgi:hypothetical protein